MDFYYLTSPAEIEKKLSVIGFNSYRPIKYSNIFFDISDFYNIQNKITNLRKIDEKKIKKNSNINQTSFYFEDYLETNKKNKIIKKNRTIFKIEFICYFFSFFFSSNFFDKNYTYITL